LLLLGIAGFASAQTAQVYRDDLGAHNQSLDIYAPLGAKNLPVVVYVHGGTWTDGNRVTGPAKPKFYNSLGYVFVSIDYRTIPVGEIEDQLHDVDHALGWLSANIAEFGGDPENIHLTGFSAGAHLVSFTAVSPQENAALLIASGALRSVISMDLQTYSFTSDALQNGTQLPPKQARAMGSDPARWLALSPLQHVDNARVAPPFLLLYSSAGYPATGRRDAARQFAERLAQANVSVELIDGMQYDHTGLNRSIGTDPDISAQIARFLAKYD